MAETKGKMTIKEYRSSDSLYLDGKCVCSMVSKDISKSILECWNSRDKFKAKADSHNDLLAACELTYKRICKNGSWDEECFYYHNTSASELEEPLDLLKAAIDKKVKKSK